MELETLRLRLRHWRDSDREPFAAINAEPEVRRYLGPMTRAGSDAMIQGMMIQFDAEGWGYWALEERQSGRLIGACGLMPVRFEAHFTPAIEIGWRLAAEWQGKGLAREAAEAALAFAFNTLGLERVVSFTVPSNTASWRLMERLGMKRIGTFDNPKLPGGHPLKPHLLYEIVSPKLAGKGH